MKSFARPLAIATLAFLAANAPARSDTHAVIVHEWGTFTSLQDEQGNAIGGINVDDEPVPEFVWGAYSVRALARKAPVYAGFGLPPYANFSKGWTPADHDVTMRLETPVLYFYPPKSAAPQSVPPLDVHVDFHGGLLSQYYPYAEGSGFPPSFPRQQEIHIGDYTTSLDWKGVRLGSTVTPVQTDDKVWTTPREVGASPLEVTAPIYDGKGGFNPQPQAEHFLFYRGIGHIDSPISLNQASLNLEQRKDIFGWIHRTFTATSSFESLANTSTESEAWLAEIRPDGVCRWEALPIELGPSGAKLLGKFVTHGFSPENLTNLKASMQTELVREGLFPDEASAMLRTWELSYFKSPGLRFFYIVPRAWVDQVLPLKITGAPTEITRVMVGRIELISDAQETILARLATGPCPNLTALKQAAQDALDQRKLSDSERQSYYGGEKPLSELGIPIPPFVQDYLNLGRFRDALIVNEQQQHPSAALAQFIKDNQLSPTP